MAVTFHEAIKELEKNTRNQSVRRIRLINGDVLEGTITTINQDMIVVKLPKQAAGQPNYTVPIASILYISDCELP